MSDHSATVPSTSKGSTTGYGVLIVVFAVIIFTLLWSFNAFSPLDFSRKGNSAGHEKSVETKTDHHSH